MRRTRLFGSLVLASGLVWLASPLPRSSAQPPGASGDAFRKEARRPSSDSFRLITELKDGTTEISAKGPDGQKHLDAIKQMAEFLVTPITHSELYKPTIERRTQDGKKIIDLGQADIDKTLDGVLNELGRYVLVPDARSKAPVNQSEYIAEFGKAVEAAIKPILADTANTPPPVKINAVRALAMACRSGAKIHAKTVTDLLTDPKVPLYLKYHALKAAENLLAAGDVMELQGPNPWKHSLPDADLANLVKAVEAIIAQMNRQFAPAPAPAATTAPAKPTNPSATGAAPAKPADPAQKIEAEFVRDPSLDVDVALFFRRQAVRTLSKVRMVVIPGPNKTMAARPGVTLARVAAGDPSFTDGATAAELADAVTGLAGLNLENSTNVDLVLDSIAAGVAAFGGEKVRLNIPAEPGKPDYKRMVAWKKLSAQMTVALNNLNQSTGKNPVALTHRTAIGNVVSVCTTYVLAPIEGEREGTTGTSVNQNQVDDYRRQNAPKSTLLVPTDSDSKVTPAQRIPGR